MISNVTALPTSDSLALRERLSLSHARPQAAAPAAAPKPAGRIVQALKTLGRGGAARLQEVEDDWQEF